MTPFPRRVRRIVSVWGLAAGAFLATLAGLAAAFRSELPPPAGEVELGVAAPEVELVGDSGPVSFRKELEGHASVVLLFRGSWCPYCRRELGRLSDGVRRQPMDGVRVMGISADPPDGLADLRRKLGLPFPLFSDREDRTAAICHFAMHCALLYDPRGVLRWAGYAENWRAPLDYTAILLAARRLR